MGRERRTVWFTAFEFVCFPCGFLARPGGGDVSVFWPGKVHLLVTVADLTPNCFAFRACGHLAGHILLFGFEACRAKKYHLFSLLRFVSLPLIGPFWADEVVHYGSHFLEGLFRLEMLVCIFYAFDFSAVDGHKNA